MAKYIFHMGNGVKKEVEAKDLEEAIEKLDLSMSKPIGTRDGKPDSVTHIESDHTKEIG